MTIPQVPEPYNNTNNPSKEIWASSGVFNKQVYASPPYYQDVPNSLVPNTGIQTTTTTTTTTPTPTSQLDNALFNGMLSSGNYFVDDMLVFNNYIHYDTKTLPAKTFNPRSFLQQSIVSFNIYSMEYK